MNVEEILNGAKDLQFDSRKCSEGSVFFAVRGTQVDGHDYIAKAIENGAKTIVCEQLPTTQVDGVRYFAVENSAKALGLAASEYYERPSEKLHLVGVTGTNGKTTIATLLYRLFSPSMTSLVTSYFSSIKSVALLRITMSKPFFLA